MWWTFFILFFLVSVVSTTIAFYSLRRITQYENLILQFQNIINITTEKMKLLDEYDKFAKESST